MQKTTMVLATGLIPFSVILFSLVLAAFASILLGNPTTPHALVFTVTLFGAMSSGLILYRWKASLPFYGIFFMEVILIGLYWGALPLLYYFSSTPSWEIVLISGLSLVTGFASGAVVTSLIHHSKETSHLYTIAAGTLLAVFCAALWLASGLDHHLISLFIGLLNALLLIGLAFYLLSDLPSKRWIWLIFGGILVAGTIVALILSNQIQNTLEYTLYQIYPSS